MNNFANKSFFSRMLKLTISIIYCLLVFLYDLFIKLVGFDRKNILTILFYHEVYKHDKDRFEWQMNTLMKNFSLVNAEFNERYLPHKYCVAITFDDAFQSVYYNALPILRKKNIPCHIFLPTGYINKNPAWDVGENHFIKNEVIMSKQQIREINGNQVIFGSHTHNHPRLSNLSIENIKIELKESKKILEDIIEENIDSLAFPHGSYDQRVINEARELGYKSLFSIFPDFERYNRDGFIRGRVPASTNDFKIEFLLKIRGCYRWLPIAIKIKKSIMISLKTIFLLKTTCL